MIYSRKPSSCSFWKFALLLLLFSAAILLLNQRVMSKPLLTTHKAFQKQSTYFNTSGRDMTKGYWHSHLTRDKYCIEFKENLQSSHWNMSRCFDKPLFEKKQTDVFHLSRQSGTLILSGRLDEEESEGTYEFREDSAFKKYLTDHNIASRDENFIFHLFLSGVGKEYIEFLQKNYTTIDGDRLLELAIHGVSLKQYQAYIALFDKYSHKVPSIQEVIEARIHGIDQEYIEQLQASGFTSLSMQKMMETKIHGVDAAYIETLRKEGFTQLSIDQILAAKIHGITPAYIKQLETLGYNDLPLDKMMEAKIHGINSSYIQDLAEAGFKNLPLEQIIEAKIHGVNSSFINEAKGKGYKLEQLGDYVDLKIQGFSRRSDRD